LHHLDRATGKSELHPHKRTGLRPSNNIVGCGDEKPLSANSLLTVVKNGSTAAACLAGTLSMYQPADALLPLARYRRHQAKK
jgi:hypothetical protein